MLILSDPCSLLAAGWQVVIGSVGRWGREGSWLGGWTEWCNSWNTLDLDLIIPPTTHPSASPHHYTTAQG